ncbi:MAG: alanine racemase [Clostridia bacterium]|nr:alanine racemase [Clostridia bacterium]
MSLPIVAEININALKTNATNIKNRLNSNVKLCAVVKADAYGHGIIEVANAIYDYVDYYACALSQEAFDLRISGIDKPILLLTPSYSENVEKLIEYDVTLSVSSIEEVLSVIKVSNLLEKCTHVHIAVNSGMNRLGFDNICDIKKAVTLIKQSKYVKITGAFSHFCKPENQKLTNSQLYTFLYLAEPIKEYDSSVILHVSASGGLLKDEKYQLDMVRVGLLFYGYKPFKSSKIDVSPIMQIKAKVIFKRTSLKGKTLLYGDETSKNDKAYIIRLGYSDGFLKQGVKNSLKALCMELSAISKVTNSDYTIVLDDAEYYAKKYNTSVYEILVNVTKRAQKVYIK